MDVIVSNHDMIVSCLIAFLLSVLRSEPNERCMICFPYYLRQVLFPFRKSDYISVCSIVLRIYAVVSTICHTRKRVDFCRENIFEFSR